jgi:ribosomal protein S18 acetylase RimI-like enzyme
MPFKIEPFAPIYTREGFNCGTPELDRYLKQYAGQDVRRNLAALFVAVKNDTNLIIGYYTLSNASIDTRIIPEQLRKKLSTYDDVPAIRIGRLAVDLSVQGQGLGTMLLANAVIRSTSNISAWAFMVVDAKDDAACAFYRKFGFESLNNDVRHLFAHRKKLEPLFSEYVDDEAYNLQFATTASLTNHILRVVQN